MALYKKAIELQKFRGDRRCEMLFFKRFPLLESRPRKTCWDCREKKQEENLREVFQSGRGGLEDSAREGEIVIESD